MLQKCFITMAALFLFGCSHTITDGNEDRDIKTFRGLFVSNNDAGNIGTRRRDSVEMTLINNVSYSLRFYDISEGEVNFCNHSGLVDNFWTNTVSFSVGEISYNNCDTLNIPKGVFKADFLTDGDIIILEHINGDTLRRLTFLK